MQMTNPLTSRARTGGVRTLFTAAPHPRRKQVAMSKPSFGRRNFLKSATLVATQPLWARSLAWAGQAVGSPAVSFDSRSLLFHGKRELMIAGEMHYARSTRAMWPTILDRSRSLGINTLAVYVFWNVHEPQRDVYNFSGEADLSYFLTLCKERGLHVFLRSGPYCCAEWNYGGFPPYLRDEPGIVMRTMNRPYLDRVEKYYLKLAEVVNPHLATRGGAVTMIQVENEYANVAKRYGAAGQEYLHWMAEFARRIGFADVPITMCEGATTDAISTLNGFEIPPSRVAEFRAKNSTDPLLWTELYPSWYSVWGETREPDPHDYTQDWETHRSHDPRTMALAILRFIAHGGAGFNYYMWHGGTNFGRTAMYLHTTSYDFHAPLDEYGRITFKGEYLGHLHHVLAAHQEFLLSGDRTLTNPSPTQQRIAWRLNGSELVLTLDFPAIPASEKDLRPINARINAPDGGTVFDVLALHTKLTASFKTPDWKPFPAALTWATIAEPLPAERPGEVVRAGQPTEQLLLTRDHTDYCWYSTHVTVATAGPQQLVIPYGGDFFYVYLDGKLVAQTQAPLKEDRGPITPEDPAHPRVVVWESEMAVKDGYRHAFTLPDVSVGSHRLDILSTALGMIKGDWQIASSMENERKGIWQGVLLNGQPLAGWEMIPWLTGEKSRFGEQSEMGHWSPIQDLRPLRWYKTEFPLSAGALAADTDYRLNAQGLGKGMLFLNGHSVGRHWLVESPGTGGQLTQQHYHLPKDWFKTNNTLIIFEETANSPAKVEIEFRQSAGVKS
jgi:hypothetical protein